jgi:hypothetical protein
MDAELCNTIYNGMADIFQQQDGLIPTFKLYEKALKIELHILLSGHPLITPTSTNIGHVNYVIKNISAALNLLRSTRRHQHLIISYVKTFIFL